MPIFGSQSSMNASGYGFLGVKEKTIESTIAPQNLSEGTQITVSVTTDGYSDGTVLYYTVRGTLGTITASDFTDSSLTGTFTINNNSGSFTKTVAVDGVIEQGEEFVIDIRAISHSSAVIETTQSVYIQASQSTFEYEGSGTNDTYSVNVPTGATTMTAKVWGAGGAGIGECPASGAGLNSGNFSGGSGGHVEGTISVTGGSTLTVYVGGSGAGSGPDGMAGSGAGDGGGLSAVKYGSNILVAGGGGGAGQASNGGYGGGNGSGNSGSGGNGGGNSGGGGSQSGGGSAGSYSGNSTSSGSSWNNGSNIVNGGDSGGSGNFQGMRGGGGGSGYFGGGGGGGIDGSNCSGGGGGGGSGIINGSWTNTGSANGNNGSGGGVSAVDTGDGNYISGYGGSSQNGLVVLIFS